MTNRERTKAILNYEPYDRMPVLHFGYWGDTLTKWAREGHITEEEARMWGDGNATDDAVAAKLGFDANYYCTFQPNSHLDPGFPYEVIEELPDGSRKARNGEGVIVLEKADAVGIPPEIDHLLKSRKEWERDYLARLQFSPDRVNKAIVRAGATPDGERNVRFDAGGLDYLKRDDREFWYGLHCGSLFGRIRNMLGVLGSTYLYAEDEALFDEIINTCSDLCYRCTKMVLESGAKFDFAHFWEDICFKNGPLISPTVFEEKVGPYYRRIVELVNGYGLNIVSLDCDGLIDALIPTWFHNGVNTMFPIEVGTWGSSIGPWRQQYGQELRGVGGMNKTVLAHDRAAVDAEIERLKPLVALGGYIPCPDHRLAPDAKWDNVRYYCDRMRKVFG